MQLEGIIAIATLWTCWHTFAEEYLWIWHFAVALEVVFGSCSAVLWSYCPWSCSWNVLAPFLNITTDHDLQSWLSAQYHVKIYTITLFELAYLTSAAFYSLSHESWLLLTCVPSPLFHVFLVWPCFFPLRQAMAVDEKNISVQLNQ